MNNAIKYFAFSASLTILFSYNASALTFANQTTRGIVTFRLVPPPGISQKTWEFALSGNKGMQEYNSVTVNKDSSTTLDPYGTRDKGGNWPNTVFYDKKQAYVKYEMSINGGTAIRCAADHTINLTDTNIQKIVAFDTSCTWG